MGAKRILCDRSNPFAGAGPGLCGNGEFNFTLGGCQCDVGWGPATFDQPDCSVYACPIKCVNGFCNSTTQGCVCNPGFAGLACDQSILASCQTRTNNCSGHGYCNPAVDQCICDSGERSESGVVGLTLLLRRTLLYLHRLQLHQLHHHQL